MKLSDGDERFIILEEDPIIKTPMLNRHSHNAFEIYFLEEGTCRYFIDDKSYDVQAGDLILIPSKTIHKTFYGDIQHKRRLIYCSSHCIPRKVADILPSLIYHYRCPQIQETVKKIFDCIEQEQKKPDEYSSHAKMSYLELLFFTLARHKPIPIQSERSFVTEAVTYIKSKFASKIRLADISKMLGVSSEHLSRAFKNNTGFGFNEYLNMVRLQNADEMLHSEKKMSISEIAYSCGFNDSNYFSEKYKKIYGITPTAARKK